MQTLVLANSNAQQYHCLHSHYKFSIWKTLKLWPSEAQSTALPVIWTNVATVLCFKWNLPLSPHPCQRPPTVYKNFCRTFFNSTGMNFSIINHAFWSLLHHIIFFYIFVLALVFFIPNYLKFLLSRQLESPVSLDNQHSTVYEHLWLKWYSFISALLKSCQQVQTERVFVYQYAVIIYFMYLLFSVMTIEILTISLLPCRLTSMCQQYRLHSIK
jgi:hypothetical protein